VHRDSLQTVSCVLILVQFQVQDQNINLLFLVFRLITWSSQRERLRKLTVSATCTVWNVT